MSWLTEALHGRKSLLQNLKEELTGVAGSATAAVVTDAAGKALAEGASYVLDNAEAYKATIEAATRSYLEAKLGVPLGDLAANVAELAVNALAGAVEAAARAVDGDPAT